MHGRKIAGRRAGCLYGTGTGPSVEPSGVVRCGVGQAGSMSTPIRIGEIMQDSRALLEQLLQVARISALEEMASGIAHELNQPIGAITTFAQAGQRMLERPEPLIGPA